jgi:hypothetical protein
MSTGELTLVTVIVKTASAGELAVTRFFPLVLPLQRTRRTIPSVV